MAAPSAIVPPIPLKFGKHVAFRSGAEGIDIQGAVDPGVAAALANNTAFPAGLEFPLAQLQIAAHAGQDILFDSGKGTVTFSARADAHAGLGLYLDPAHLVSDTGIDHYMGDSLVLARVTSGYYLVLTWGYENSASANGSVALGAPSISFGAEGAATRNYAVIKEINGNPKAASAITDTLDSWTLPSLVSSPADLAPNTWLFAETDGHFKASLGATYGYDFNWVREATLGGLTGDIGLKIQLRISAALSIEVSSASAVVVHCESPQVLRLWVFKQPKKGWQFAFNAAAQVTPVTPELAKNLDDFVLSILDLHNQQLLKDLNDLKDWASGQVPLSGALAGIAPRYMEQLLQTVYTAATGRPFDFEQSKAQVLQFLNTWGGLDSKVAGLIWNNFLDQPLVAKMADICQQITKCNTPADYVAFIDKNVSQPTFLSGPTGQWLESLALGAILQPINNDQAFANVKSAVATASEFLAAGTSEQAMLKALHTWIDPKINLPAIDKVKSSLDLAQLDGWIKAKLQKFLDQTFLSLADLQKIQATIQLLYSKADSFYEHARKALSDTYTFSFGELYQSTSTSTALLDVEFDFGDANANPAELKALVQAVMGGDFTGVLGTTQAGVKLNRALLSHELVRHNHIEVRLPFYKSTFDEVNRSLATADSVGSDAGRILVYQLDAKDDIGAITNRGGSYSHLGLAASLPGPRSARHHGPANFSYTYVYRAASSDMRRAQLQYQVGAYVDAYLGGTFQSADASFDTWLGDLDRAVQHEPTDHYGHTLLELSVNLKSDAVAQWLNAPADDKSQTYMRMSLALQRSGLKTLLPFYYFNDARQYHDKGAAYPLIVFSCIPSAVSVNPETLQPTYRDVYWDYVDPNLRHKMILQDRTREIVRAALTGISKRLAASGMKDDAGRYAPEDTIIDNIRGSVLDDPRLLGLLQSEAQMVEGSRAAGLAMAKFRARAGDPQTAVRAFAAWGADVTRTFNGVSSVYGGNALRPLGTMMFVVASAVLGGQLYSPSALLRVAVLKPDVTFDDSQFLQGMWPGPGTLLLQQAIVRA